MSEGPLRAACRVPETFSSDTRTPFKYLGMDNLSDQSLFDFFRNKTVLDIGSGYEGISRRLFAIFGKSPDAPTVINLNPQLSDWRMVDITLAGSNENVRKPKAVSFEGDIRRVMEVANENSAGYFSKRIAVAGLVQQLPFERNSVDVALSTWAFPRCIIDFGGTTTDLEAGFSEIDRVLASDGIAIMGPVYKRDLSLLSEPLSSADIALSRVQLTPKQVGLESDEYILQIG